MKNNTLIGAILCALLFTATIHAQSSGSYDLTWNTIAGGGGTSSSAQFTLIGTIGQPDAGFSSGVNCSLTGGFWGVTALTQPAPRLKIRRSGSNVIVSWPISAKGYVLQATDKLTSQHTWTIVNTPIVPQGEEFTVTLPTSGPQGFFRLLHP